MSFSSMLPDSTEIRAMSFNILGVEPGPDAETEQVSERWANRAALNVRTIKRYRPDVIGFQEFEDFHFDTYGSELPEYAHDIAGAHPAGAGMGNAIFWRTDRFRCADAGVFRADLPRIETGDGPCENEPFACWVLLEDKLDPGSRLLVANTQFEDAREGEPWRQICAAALIEQLPHAAGDSPAIVTGDFNCSPWSVPYRLFMAAGSLDTYRAAGNADSVAASTFHGFHGTGYFALEWGNNIFWRVDWILSRDAGHRVQTASCTIVHDAEPPLYPSDHWPVVTEFMLLPPG